MCGRFLLDADVEELLDRYRKRKVINSMHNEKAIQGPEVFPTNRVPIITSSPDIILMKWGFLNPYAKTPVINARGETVHEKPMFKNALINRRCLIPANAFFEWKKDGMSKIKYKIYLENEKLFSMAGLYGDFNNSNGESFRAFTIITTSPNNFMSQIHDRMPVILPRELEDEWLDQGMKDMDYLRKLLIPLDEAQHNMKAVAMV